MLLGGIVADQQDRPRGHRLAQRRRDVLLAGNGLGKRRIISGAVMIDIVRSQNRTSELLQQVVLFISRPVRTDHADGFAALTIANLLESAGDVIDGLLPRDGNQFAVTANERLCDAIIGVGEIEGVSALDAEEIAIDAAFVAIVAANDLHSAFGTADAESCFASIATVRAYGADVGHFPRTSFVAISTRGERADRADVDAHAALFALEVVLFIGSDERSDAAILDA